MKSSLAFALAFVLSCFLAFSQEGPVAPEPTPEEAKNPGHIRVWAMLFDEKVPLAVKFKGKSGEPQVLLDASVAKPVQGGYSELPKGEGEISISLGGVPLPSITVKLVPDDYRTLLVYKKGGRLVTDLLQDPLPGQKDFPHTLRLLNFGTGRNMEIWTGSEKRLVVPDDTFLTSPFDGPGTVNLMVILPNPAGGDPATSATDVTFGSYPSWSVVVVPDYKGRCRPRVSPDGRE